MNPQPEIFGFHENADITKNRNETLQAFEAILSTQQNQSSSAGGNKDQIVIEVAEKILNGFPEVFDIKDAEEKYPVLYEQSMNTVLT